MRLRVGGRGDGAMTQEEDMADMSEAVAKGSENGRDEEKTTMFRADVPLKRLLLQPTHTQIEARTVRDFRGGKGEISLAH